MWRPVVSVITTLYYVVIVFHHSLHAFTVLCVYSMFGHHPHLLDYLCDKFCFFCDSHCWISPWRKITYSVTHSLTHSPSLFDACASELHAATVLNTVAVWALATVVFIRIDPIFQICITRKLHSLFFLKYHVQPCNTRKQYFLQVGWLFDGHCKISYANVDDISSHQGG